MVYRFLLNQFRHLFCYDEWNIGIWYKPIGESFVRFSAGNSLVPKKQERNYRADPFGVKREGKLYIFFEGFDARRREEIFSSLSLTEEARFGTYKGYGILSSYVLSLFI